MKMLSQSKLIKIRDNLGSTFSKFDNRFSVTQYVEEKMRVYLTSGLYTDARCDGILKDAVAVLESDINEKYTKIANEINKFLEELKEIVYTDTRSPSFSENDFDHLAVGAGAGLAAAIIFGGPVGWLVGAGVVLGALFNSSQKKKGLIDKIVQIADRMNGEAISRLESILDRLIIPAPRVVKKKQRAHVQPAVAFIEEKLSSEQLAIKNFLEKRNIRYLVHFTETKNLSSIQRNNLLSVNEGKRKGVDIKIYDNDCSGHRIEYSFSVDRKDYISLSVSTLNIDLIRAYKFAHNITEFAILYIDASILWKEINNDRIYCDRNASMSSVKFGRKIEDFENMFAEEISGTTFEGKQYSDDRFMNGIPDNETTNPQAEIWFKGSIDYEKYVERCEMR